MGMFDALPDDVDWMIYGGVPAEGSFPGHAPRCIFIERGDARQVLGVEAATPDLAVSECIRRWENGDRGHCEADRFGT